MTEQIPDSSLFEQQHLIGELVEFSIGRDLEVEAIRWLIRGPIERIIVTQHEHDIPKLYFDLKWVAEQVSGNWRLSGQSERVAIGPIDGVWLETEDGNYYLIAPSQALLNIQIHPLGDNLQI